MPRQNRVTPFGEIVSIPERGLVMGNRGRLHDENGQLRRAWQVRRWLLCRLEFKGRQRPVMAPDRYTELFFLDEATGLAAGHRPCFECRRGAFRAYARAWTSDDPGASPPTAGSMDERLHAERLTANGSKQVFRTKLDELPDGVIVTLEGRDREAYLIRGDELIRWSPGGYRERRTRPRREWVSVLTPPSTVKVIRAGYSPEIHPSVLS